MKKSILILVAFLVVNFGLNYVQTLLNLDSTLGLGLKAAVKLGLVFFVLKAIFRQAETWNFSKANGLWLAVCVVIVALSFYQMNALLFETPHQGNYTLNTVYLLSCLGTGFFEELLFRVFVFSAFFYLAYNKVNTIKRYYRSIFWTSLLFGLAHFPNAFKDSYDIYGVITQIVFAFFIGLVLQGLVIRFNSVILIGSLHGLVNYFGSYRSRLELPVELETGSLMEFLINLAILSLVMAIICIPMTHLLIRKAIDSRQAEATP